MTTIRREFVDELGRKHCLVITHDGRGVTISTFGPEEKEVTFTPLEATVIRELLHLIEPAYKDLPT